MPVGEARRVYVNAFVGRSESVARELSVNVTSSLMLVPGMAASTGATFTSLTMAVNVFDSLSGGVPLSSTWTVIVFVLGPCASVGVQVSRPLLALIEAP